MTLGKIVSNLAQRWAVLGTETGGGMLLSDLCNTEVAKRFHTLSNVRY